MANIVGIDLGTTYSAIALVYPTAKLISIGKSNASKQVKAERQARVLRASVIGAIPIINIVAVIIFMPVVLVSEIIN